MVDDFRTFAAWSLGVLSALAVAGLFLASRPRDWAFIAVFFVVILLAAFWRVSGTACAETVQFFQCAGDAYRIRKGIDVLHKQNGLIIRASEKPEADTWERQTLCRRVTESRSGR